MWTIHSSSYDGPQLVNERIDTSLFSHGKLPDARTPIWAFATPNVRTGYMIGMKAAFASLAMVSLSTGVMAQSEPSTLSMTCAQAKEIVSSRGAVVLHTGPTTYDRFVRDDNFCNKEEAAPLAYVRTADVAECPIGRVCRSQGRTGPVLETE
jgi:hypothetical protein